MTEQGHLKLVLTLAGLMLLLGLTYFLAHVELGVFNTPLGIGIGALKALLVGLFFMELRASDGIHRFFAITGILLLIILISLSMMDFVSRGWLTLPGQFPA